MRSNFSWPRARSRHWVVRLVRGAWTLPTNVVGHGVGRLLSGPPRRVQGPAAVGWLYPLRAGVRLPGLHAITLGHAIVYRRSVLAGAVGRAVLAHELAHTRQHDVLGPFYLPLHALVQAVSWVLTLVRRGPVHSRVHDYNPLEHTWICLGATACYELAAGRLVETERCEEYMAWLGASDVDYAGNPSRSTCSIASQNRSTSSRVE